MTTPQFRQLAAVLWSGSQKPALYELVSEKPITMADATHSLGITHDFDESRETIYFLPDNLFTRINIDADPDVD
jgi:hypothetical protein